MPLQEDVHAELDRRLDPVDATRPAAFPGERTTRQPVHTCHVPAEDGSRRAGDPRALAPVVLRGLDRGAGDDAEVRMAAGIERAVREGIRRTHRAGRTARNRPWPGSTYHPLVMASVTERARSRTRTAAPRVDSATASEETE